MPMNACPGVSDPATSSPTAFSLTLGDELLDDRERHVGLEQRKSHLAQGVLDVGIGEPRLATELLDDAGEPLREIVEHRIESVSRGGRGSRRRSRAMRLG